MKLTPCRDCGEPLRWARTCHNRPIPLDAEPADDGDVMFRDDGKVVAYLPWVERVERYRRHRCAVRRAL